MPRKTYEVTLDNGKVYEVDVDVPDSSPATTQNIPAAPSPLGATLREGALGFASGMGLPETTEASDFSILPGLKELSTNKEAWKAIGSGIYESQAEQFRRAKEAMKAKDFYSAAVHGLGGAVPLIGPAAVAAGEEIGGAGQQGGMEGKAHGVGSALGILASLGMGTKKGQAITDKAISKTGSAIINPTQKLLKKSAVGLTDSALGITGKNKGFGKTPGEAVLQGTKGLKPSNVAAFGRKTLDVLGGYLEQSYKQAEAAGRKASLQPALSFIDDEIRKAVLGQNDGLAKELAKQRERLSIDLQTKQPLGPDIAPTRMWEIKKQWGDKANWNPSVDPKIKGRIDRGVYRLLDSELDKIAPDSSVINQKYSSLREGTKRAEVVARNQRTLPAALIERVVRPTGVLVGGLAGYQLGGPAGALAGVALPELVARPELRMGLARGLYGAAKAKSPAVGSGTLKAVIAARSMGKKK